MLFEILKDEDIMVEVRNIKSMGNEANCEEIYESYTPPGTPPPCLKRTFTANEESTKAVQPILKLRPLTDLLEDKGQDVSKDPRRSKNICVASGEEEDLSISHDTNRPGAGTTSETSSSSKQTSTLDENQKDQLPCDDNISLINNCFDQIDTGVLKHFIKSIQHKKSDHNSEHLKTTTSLINLSPSDGKLKISPEYQEKSPDISDIQRPSSNSPSQSKVTLSGFDIYPNHSFLDAMAEENGDWSDISSYDESSEDETWDVSSNEESQTNEPPLGKILIDFLSCHNAEHCNDKRVETPPTSGSDEIMILYEQLASGPSSANMTSSMGQQYQSFPFMATFQHTAASQPPSLMIGQESVRAPLTYHHPSVLTNSQQPSTTLCNVQPSADFVTTGRPSMAFQQQPYSTFMASGYQHYYSFTQWSDHQPPTIAQCQPPLPLSTCSRSQYQINAIMNSSCNAPASTSQHGSQWYRYHQSPSSRYLMAGNVPTALQATRMNSRL